MSSNPENRPRPKNRFPYLILCALLAALAWVYWPPLLTMIRKWSDDPQYSHGFLVVPFAIFLLWTRLDHLTMSTPSAWGIVLIGAGSALRLGGARYYFDWFEGVSLLVCLAGVVLVVGGWGLLRWSWPAVAFLLFMVPLPHRIETALAGLLQDISTNACAVLLHTLGKAAVVEGNVLIINGNRIEVVTACSGLGSLLVFFAMATAVALLSERPMLDRMLLVASAIPIALAANAIRITATVLLQESSGDPAAFETFHELAGWFMMGLALAILWLELHLLRLVFIDPQEEEKTSGKRVPLSPLGPHFMILGAVALLVTLVHGVVHGFWSARWTDSGELQARVAKLDEIPLQLGDWQGVSLQLDPKRQALGEIEGYVLRRYVHRKNKAVVSLLIVCGKAGPISVHPPDVCYRGAGFDIMDEPQYVSLDDAAFRAATFRKRGETAARLRIFWSWNEGQGWRVPSSPRFTFGGAPALYKMYAVREVAGVLRDAESDPAAEFLRILLPVLDTTLFGKER